MKTFIVAVGIVAIMGLLVELTYNKPVEVIQQEVVKEVTPEWATDEEAVEAAQAVLRRKELENELSVLKEDKVALESKIEAIEKELGTY